MWWHAKCTLCEVDAFTTDSCLLVLEDSRRLATHHHCFRCAACGEQLSWTKYVLVVDGEFTAFFCHTHAVGNFAHNASRGLAAIVHQGTIHRDVATEVVAFCGTRCSHLLPAGREVRETPNPYREFSGGFLNPPFVYTPTHAYYKTMYEESGHDERRRMRTVLDGMAFARDSVGQTVHATPPDRRNVRRRRSTVQKAYDARCLQLEMAELRDQGLHKGALDTTRPSGSIHRQDWEMIWQWRCPPLRDVVSAAGVDLPPELECMIVGFACEHQCRRRTVEWAVRSSRHKQHVHTHRETRSRPSHPAQLSLFCSERHLVPQRKASQQELSTHVPYPAQDWERFCSSQMRQRNEERMMVRARRRHREHATSRCT